MIRAFLALALALLGCSASALAQAVPRASSDNPRIQSVAGNTGEVIELTLMPDTAMTVAFGPGESVHEVSVEARDLIAARVAAGRTTLQLLPQTQGYLGALTVTTNLRRYRFTARTGLGAEAGYLVQVRDATPGMSPANTASPVLASESGPTWGYRLRGDREVIPARIFDDGVRTSIIFAPEAALPAIFAIGPTGDEQLVNGYMRDDVFVIDRVWSQLVFRIDKEKATARRNPQPEANDG